MKKAISLLSLVFLLSTHSFAQTFTVNSTADTSDDAPGDGICSTADVNSEGQDECTLRAALEELSDTSDPLGAIINFAIPDSDDNYDGSTWLISPSATFPVIDYPLEMDGSTQNTAACGDLMNLSPHTLRIAIDGTGTPAGVDGFDLRGDFEQSVRGFVIQNFPDRGITIRGTADKSIDCNYLGTDVSGTAAAANGRGVTTLNFTDGVKIFNNLISGNSNAGVGTAITNVADNVYVYANLIGTDIAGTSAIPNGTGIGMFGTSGYFFGQDELGNPAGNLVSGNTGQGISFGATGGSRSNLVVNNTVGLDISNNVDLGNGGSGLRLGTGHNTNTIDSNYISGNGEHGILVNAADNNIVTNNFIGTNSNGAELGNDGNGVYFGILADDNSIGAIGEENIISFNGGAGVFIEHNPGNDTGWTFGNSIKYNSIHSNTGLGIDIAPEGLNANDLDDVDIGSSNLQNSPEISTIDAGSFLSGNNITITYSVDSDPVNSVYPLTVQFFLSDSSGDEGETLLGTDTYLEADHTSLLAGEKTVTFGIGLDVQPTDFIGATATDAEGNTSEFSITPADISLPVELSTFSAEIIDDQIQAQWITLTETSNAGFEVQTGDGNNWTQIGFVQGQGDSEIESNYSFYSSDYSVHDTFLRLKQIDFDGQFKYSKLVELKHDIPIAGVLSEAYPNPTLGQSTLRFSSGSNGAVKARLFDITGNEIAVVLDENVPRGESREMSIDLSGLSQGVYFVQVESRNGSFTRKISVLR